MEVWVWNDHRTHLIRPPGGWWLDPVFHEQQHEQLHSGDSSGNRSECPFCRLTDPSLENFEPPKPLALGEGLPGVLWAELDRNLEGRDVGVHTNHNNNNSNPSRRASLARPKLIMHDHHRRPSPKQLVWRQVDAIANDPDQPWNPRLQLLAQSNNQSLTTKLGWVSAVPFDIHGSQGMVLYMARQGCSLARLQHATNENYLISAATLIGAAVALRTPRQATVDQRRMELHETMARVKQQIRLLGRQALVAKGILQKTSTTNMSSSDKESQSILSPLEVEGRTYETLAPGDRPSAVCSSYLQTLTSHMQRVWRKLWGGGGGSSHHRPLLGNRRPGRSRVC